MERNAQKYTLINLLTLAAAAIAGYAVARYSHALSGAVSVLFMVLGVLVSAVSWFQTRLEERERLEKLEFDELTRTAASSALFTTGETEVFPAQRSREQFERFFVPGFTVLLFLLQLGGGIFLLRAFQTAMPAPVQQPLVCLSFFGMFFLLLFLLGRISTGFARLEGSRLLRPGATYLLLCAYLCFLVLIGVGVTWFGFSGFDLLLARLLAVLLLGIGLETLLNLLLEMYRPRVKGKVQRPLYESRLVSLLGQPEGLITTAAQTLDYQFGFNVSETWVYRLFARWLPWLILGQLAVLLLSTCVVFIEPGEQAVLERSGKFVAVLGPGGHLKFPWPVDAVHRYPADNIQTLNVGSVPDQSNPLAGNTVLWTVSHAVENNFLVANRQLGELDTDTNATNRAPPVSLLTVSIPVQYLITNLTDWVYNNQSPDALLEQISYREVVRYLVSVDLQRIMSVDRLEAAQILRDRIQAEAARHNLGVNIVFVGLQDIHPPVAVAGEYEKVVATIHQTNAAYLNARAFAIATNAQADARAFQIVSRAQSEKISREVAATARAALFTNQIPSYLASPLVYTHWKYLDALVRASATARMYVTLATNTHDVVILNLEDKIQPNLLNELAEPAPAPAKPK